MINDNFSVNVPLNSVSFGQVSFAILREIFKLGLKPNIFPIGGGVDASAQKIEPEFGNWLNECIGKANRTHQRDFPVLRLWHLNGSLESVSKDNQLLLSFYECDSPTPEELNAVKQNKKVVLTSKYSADIFNNFGCDNVIKIPLGFDYSNFNVTKKEYIKDRITFSVLGKYEPLRKQHGKIIQSWIKRFGNNPKYFLHCAIQNPFIPPEEMKMHYQQLVNGNKPANVEFFGWMNQNAVYNDWLNAADVVIGMGNESWGLPEFHSIALGKHAVMLNVNGYKEYINKENSVIVNPNGKIDAHDGKFFIKGTQYNQGQFFTWDDNEFIAACEEAIKRVEKNKVNTAGLELQTKFTYENTTKQLLEELSKL